MKKVHVRVYADGPTRVLEFSDEQYNASPEEEGGLLNLGYRLQQVNKRLKQVGAKCSVCRLRHAGAVDELGE